MLMEQKVLFSFSVSLEAQAEKTDSGFPKTFQAGHLFVFAEYLRNQSSVMKTKNFKNYTT